MVVAKGRRIDHLDGHALLTGILHEFELSGGKVDFGKVPSLGWFIIPIVVLGILVDDPEWLPGIILVCNLLGHRLNVRVLNRGLVVMDLRRRIIYISCIRLVSSFLEGLRLVDGKLFFRSLDHLLGNRLSNGRLLDVARILDGQLLVHHLCDLLELVGRHILLGNVRRRPEGILGCLRICHGIRICSIIVFVKREGCLSKRRHLKLLLRLDNFNHRQGLLGTDGDLLRHVPCGQAGALFLDVDGRRLVGGLNRIGGHAKAEWGGFGKRRRLRIRLGLGLRIEAGNNLRFRIRRDGFGQRVVVHRLGPGHGLEVVAHGLVLVVHVVLGLFVIDRLEVGHGDIEVFFVEILVVVVFLILVVLVGSKVALFVFVDLLLERLLLVVRTLHRVSVCVLVQLLVVLGVIFLVVGKRVDDLDLGMAAI